MNIRDKAVLETAAHRLLNLPDQGSSADWLTLILLFGVFVFFVSFFWKLGTIAAGWIFIW